MYCGLFNQFSINEPFGLFSVFATTNCVVALCISLFLFLLIHLWDRFLEEGLCGQRVNAHVILLNTAKFTSIEIVPFKNSHWQ